MRIRRDVLESIVAHARRERPRECCGLLIGTDEEVLEAVAATNVAADPLRHYEVSPADHFAQIRRCRESATERPVSVVGGYHSHPRTAPEPSATDLELAFEGFLYLIAGPASEDTVDVRAYQLKAGRLERIDLQTY